MRDRAERKRANLIDSGDSGLGGGLKRSGGDERDKAPRDLSGPAATPGSVGREPPGAGTELASYRVSSGERLLVCAAGKGGLEILDVDADFLGPSYRVDRALEDESALWAVVDDYLAQAKRLDAPPMSSAALRTLMLKRHD